MNVRLVVSVGICVLVIAGGTLFFAARISPSVKNTAAPVEKTAPASVTVKDSFKKGTHTITGVVTVATPCTAMDAASSVDTASDPEIIHITVTTTPSDGICLLRPQEKTFTLKVNAPESATISTTVDGVTSDN